MKSTYWTFAVTLVAVAAARAETVDITYEDGAVESGSVSLYVTNANGAKATFRTKGAFLMPGVETERASHPFDFGYWLKDSVKQFLLRFNADTVYKNDDKTVLWTYDRKMPVLAATNAFVRMELTDDNRAELHFDSGYFNSTTRRGRRRTDSSR